MSCVVNAQTNGLCPQYTFNAANNQITGYSYDAAGDLTADGTYGYTWDAEGRVASITGSGVSEANTYNALGQVAVFSTASYNSSKVFDPAGQWVGQYNVTGGYWWPEYVRLGGRVVAFNSQGTNNTVFLHKDLETTTHMVTGPSGSLIQDQIFYPWGQSWQSVGTWYQQEFAGLDFFNPDDSLYVSLTRQYNPTPGRWLSPDPLGGDVSNPQSLNRYAYALNSPTTLTDPFGLDSNACNDPWYASSHAECGEDPICEYFFMDCGGFPPGPGGEGGGGPTSTPGLSGVPGGPGMPGIPDNPPVGSDVCVIFLGDPTCIHTTFPAPNSGSGGSWWGKLPPILGAVAPWLLKPGANGGMQAAAQATRQVQPTIPRVPNPVPGEAPEIQLEDPFWKNIFRLMSEWLLGGGNGLFPSSTVALPIVSPCVMPQFQYLPMCGGTGVAGGGVMY